MPSIIRHLESAYKWFFVEHRGLAEKFKSRKIYMEMLKSGKLNEVDHEVKQKNIRHYAEKYNCTILVETGTFKGEMVEAMKSNFSRIYSIEINQVLYEAAKEHFADDLNISILNGDSTDILPQVIKEVEEHKTIFWLDGHYSGGETGKGKKDTPILAELATIFSSKIPQYVILIDDARLFNGMNDYPTFPELDNFLAAHKNNNMKLEVDDDIIRLVPDSSDNK